MKNNSIIEPRYHSVNNEKNTLKLMINKLNKGSIVLDLGAGLSPYKKEFVGKDLNYISIDFEGNHDYVIDLNEGLLPFEDNSIDCICLFQVLEHIFETKHLLEEINRVLKKGGYLLISTPFVFPLHGIPYDFHRYTQYFYERIGIKYNLEIMNISSGIYGLGNILYMINLFIGYYGFIKIYKIITSPIIIINNMLIYINNKITKLIPKALVFSLKNNLVSDYVVLYKKN